jgi:hypothetical protein
VKETRAAVHDHEARKHCYELVTEALGFIRNYALKNARAPDRNLVLPFRGRTSVTAFHTQVGSSASVPSYLRYVRSFGPEILLRWRIVDRGGRSSRGPAHKFDHLREAGREKFRVESRISDDRVEDVDLMLAGDLLSVGVLGPEAKDPLVPSENGPGV